MTGKQNKRLLLALCLVLVWPVCADDVKPLRPEDLSSPDYDLKLSKARQELAAERERLKKLEQESAAEKKRVAELEQALERKHAPDGDTILPSWLFRWSWQNGALVLFGLLILWWLVNRRGRETNQEDRFQASNEKFERRQRDMDANLKYISARLNSMATDNTLAQLDDIVNQAKQLPSANVSQPATRSFQDAFLDGSAQGPEMVIVPDGKFLMGSAPDEKGRDDFEGPQRTVSITRPFAVGKYPVTRGQFAAFVRETRYDTGNESWTFEDGKVEKRAIRNWQNPGYDQSDDHPVVCVNWDDAQAYAAWLSGKTGKAYRLLSEAEWEYACRAGGRHRYSGSDDIDAVAWYGYEKCGKKTHPVGRKQDNAWGLHDMSGNVWEWVEDCWNDSYKDAPIDGSAWTSGECDVRVVRGGSWNFKPDLARAAFRLRLGTAERYDFTGFRLARMLP